MSSDMFVRSKEDKTLGDERQRRPMSYLDLLLPHCDMIGCVGGGREEREVERRSKLSSSRFLFFLFF